jgi:fumarylacetoacetase
MSSWIEYGNDSDFPLENIPWGIISTNDAGPRGATIIGNMVIDLAALARLGYFDGMVPQHIFDTDALNPFIALGKPATSAIRRRIIELFQAENPLLRDNNAHRELVLIPADMVRNHLPIHIGDYTDFYSSMEHASNVGKMFRDPANALLPNWKHIPVGYHGRASSIVISGTNIHRPLGQTMPDGHDKPVFGPSRQVDFELEMAFVIGKENALGDAIPVENAEDHIFGMLLFNDLSARDIQKWEYVPLGPFLSKNFGSILSPWIVSLEALEPFRTAGPSQDIEVLPYLKHNQASAFDIKLEVILQPASGKEQRICLSNFKHLYWSMPQQLAHHTVNGCNMRVGDLCASGTISGPTEDSFGSMLELAWKGTKPLTMPDGSQRSFVNDGDTLIMRAWAENNNLRIGFGETKTQILPARHS